MEMITSPASPPLRCGRRPHGNRPGYGHGEGDDRLGRPTRPAWREFCGVADGLGHSAITPVFRIFLPVEEEVVGADVELVARGRRTRRRRVLFGLSRRATRMPKAPDWESDPDGPGWAGWRERGTEPDPGMVPPRPGNRAYSQVPLERASRGGRAHGGRRPDRVSPKPAVTTTAAGTPRAPQSAMTSGTLGGGTTTTARSAGAGMAATLAYAGRPRTRRCRGLTA